MTWRRVALAVALCAALGACTDDDQPATPTSTPQGGSSPSEDLTDRLVTMADLPAGFAPVTDVDDTITTFCAGQDAAAGLQASGRAIAGFSRTPAGASVIHLVLRFDDDGAERFVTQAEDLLTSCNDVPDATGLAFTYEPVSEPVAAALAGTDRTASRYGVNVGSGTLTIELAAFQRGGDAHLIAVLGLDQERESLDALAAEAFAAAVARAG